jgi:hypothetical protein
LLLGYQGAGYNWIIAANEWGFDFDRKIQVIVVDFAIDVSGDADAAA